MLPSLPLAKTWRFVHGIDEACDDQSIEGALLDVTQPLGIVLIGGGLVPTLKATAQEIRNRMFFQRFPD